jgi:exonuclease SbcC
VRPIRLEIHGIRSFRARQTIDFADLDFFAILGDTGAGKSSILEAMMYALFNASTWSGSGVKELMSTGATSMQVQFTFRIDGRECTITRLTPRVGVAIHRLDYASDPPERRDSEAAIGRFVRERFHIDRETFMRTVMLPQGRFSELLLMKPADRANFLADVLGLTVLDRMAESVKRSRDDATSRRARLRAVRDELPGDPTAAIATAETIVLSADEAWNAIQDRVRRHSNARKDAVECRAAVAVVENALALLATGSTLVATLKSIEDIEKPLAEEMSRCSSLVNEIDLRCKTTRTELEDRSLAGTDAASLRLLVSSLASIADLERRAAVERERLTRERAAESDKRSKLVTRESECGALREVESSAEDVVARATSERDVYEAEMHATMTAGKEIANATIERDAARAALDEASSSAKRTEASYERAHASWLEASEAQQRAEKALAVARRADSAAHAASGLHEGDACPVCTRSLPRGFQPPASPALASSEAAFKACAESHNKARGILAKADAARIAAIAAVQAAGEALERRSDTLRQVVAVWTSHGLTENVAENAAAIASLGQRRGDVDDRVIAAQAAISAARNAREAAERALAREQESAHGAAAKVLDTQARLKEFKDTSSARRTTVPTAYRPSTDATSEEITRSAESIDQLLITAEETERAWASDELRLTEAARALKTAGDAWTKQVERPRRKALAELAPTIYNVLARLGFDETLPEDDASPLAAASFVAHLATAIDNARERTLVGLASAKGRVDSAEANAFAILLEAGVDNEKALDEARDECFRMLTLRRRDVEDARERGTRAADLNRSLAVIEPVADVLTELGDALTPGRFPKFIVERKQLELLQVATTILGRMTADRYGFSTTLGIVDRSISQERRPHTLSGGETFLASLALSLALVEISERSGVRFESLFLDEGFGTLDPAAFEQALTELEHQVSQGRMIAVITHVARVREFIDDVVRVKKTAEGSEVSRESAASVA